MQGGLRRHGQRELDGGAKFFVRQGKIGNADDVNAVPILPFLCAGLILRQERLSMSVRSSAIVETITHADVLPQQNVLHARNKRFPS